MNDKKNVIIGLAFAVFIGTFPIWYSAACGGESEAPELVFPEEATQCVEGTEYMVGYHMDLLDEWRDDAVREGNVMYTSHNLGVPEGSEWTDDVTYEMSLTRTCLDCHSSREEFCDRCHDYTNVEPYCWDCHFEPEGWHEQE